MVDVSTDRLEVAAHEQEPTKRVVSIWTAAQMILWAGNAAFVLGVLYETQRSHGDRITTVETRQDTERLELENLKATQPEQDRRLTVLENALLIHQAEDLKRALK